MHPRRPLSFLLLLVLCAVSVTVTPARGLADPLGVPALQSDERVDLAHIPRKIGVPTLDSRLYDLVAAQRGGSISATAETGRKAGLATDGTTVRVVVETGGDMAEARAAVADAGGAVEVQYEAWLQAQAPVAELERLSTAPGVRYVRAPYTPVASAVTSEGVADMGLSDWHNLGLRGGGAKLAVLDLGFDGYWNLLGTELPAQPVVRSFRVDGDITGSGDTHGTAAAEVAFDVAPEATFYLVNFGTEAEMGTAVDWLISEHVSVISSSVGWPGTAYGDGRGTVNTIVARAEKAGITWVQAAGNYGNSHWTGFFNDPDGNGFHNFRGSDEGNTIHLRRASPSDERIFRIEVFLTWDDWDTLTQDYDLFLFRGESVVAQSTAFQNGRFPPLEHIVYTTASPGDYWIGVQRFRATRRAKLDLAVTTDYDLEYREPAESLVVPADSPAALTVGAVTPGTLDVRTYSSRGPTKDGRPKPDFVAADGVSTASAGPQAFAGTSASAPAVAGAAALYLGARPGQTPARVGAFLSGRSQGGNRANTVLGYGSIVMGTLPPAAALPLVTRGASLTATAP